MQFHEKKLLSVFPGMHLNPNLKKIQQKSLNDCKNKQKNLYLTKFLKIWNYYSWEYLVWRTVKQKPIGVEEKTLEILMYAMLILLKCLKGIVQNVQTFPLINLVLALSMFDCEHLIGSASLHFTRISWTGKLEEMKTKICTKIEKNSFKEDF